MRSGRRADKPHRPLQASRGIHFLLRPPIGRDTPLASRLPRFTQKPRERNQNVCPTAYARVTAYFNSSPIQNHARWLLLPSSRPALRNVRRTFFGEIESRSTTFEILRPSCRHTRGINTAANSSLIC